MQSQMSTGQMPCSPPLGVNSQMPTGPRPGQPGTPMGPGLGGDSQVPPPSMGGPQMMGPGGYGGPPMPGGPGGYGTPQMMAGGNQMMMGSGPAVSGAPGMAPMDCQMGVGGQNNMAASQQGAAVPSSQQPPGMPQSVPVMPGPAGGSGTFGPSMASQMHPNGTAMMAPPSVSGGPGPMTSLTGSVSGIGSSLPVSSPAGSSQTSAPSSVSASQPAAVSAMSNQIPGAPFMTSGSSTMSSPAPPSSSTGAQALASGGGSMVNQMGGVGGFPGMQPHQTGGMMPAAEVNGSQPMMTGPGSMVGNGQMGPAGLGPVGQVLGGPSQAGVPGPGAMSMPSSAMMGGPATQMQNSMVTPGGTQLSSGSGMPGGRPGAQFMGGPPNTGQMGPGLPSSAVGTTQMVGGTAPRMPNPANVIGPSPGGPMQQAMPPYGYGSSVGPGPGQPQHQASAMNNMYGWNASSSGGGGPMPQNMMSQGTDTLSVFLFYF